MRNPNHISRRDFIKVITAAGSALLVVGQGRQEVGAAPQEQSLGPIPMAKKVEITVGGKKVQYGYLTQGEVQIGAVGGNKIYLSRDGGATWSDTNFNDMALDNGGRPSVFVIDAVVNTSGTRAFFLVSQAVSTGSGEFLPVSPHAKKGPGYVDTKHGFVKNRSNLEVEMADGTANLKPVDSFPGIDPANNKLKLIQTATNFR